MVVANTQVDLAALKSRHSLWPTWWRLRACRCEAGDECAKRPVPSTKRPKARSPCTPTRSGFIASAAGPREMCWTSSSAQRGSRSPKPSRGWAALLGLRPGLSFGQKPPSVHAAQAPS